MHLFPPSERFAEAFCLLSVGCRNDRNGQSPHRFDRWVQRLTLRGATDDAVRHVMARPYSAWLTRQRMMDGLRLFPVTDAADVSATITERR
jgi:hypothetical protein